MRGVRDQDAVGDTCRPYGTPDFLERYPGLTPWAKTYAAPPELALTRCNPSVTSEPPNSRYS
jgi:hypothetical protein